MTENESSGPAEAEPADASQTADAAPNAIESAEAASTEPGAPAEPHAARANVEDTAAAASPSAASPSAASPSSAAPSAEAPSAEAPSERSASGDAAADEADSAEAESGEADTGEADSGEADSGEADSGEAAEGEGGKKKRKRRRRRKKKGEGAEGDASSPGTVEAGSRESGAPKRKEAHAPLPFHRYFEGGARRHAFSPGEIVAGRVLEVREDVAVVDLFGKALAYARACEPRDVPLVPEPLPDPAAVAAPSEPSPAEAPAGEAAGSEAPATSADASEAASEPVALADSTVADSTVADSTVASSTVASSTVASSTVASSTVASSTVAGIAIDATPVDATPVDAIPVAVAPIEVPVARLESAALGATAPDSPAPEAGSEGSEAGAADEAEGHEAHGDDEHGEEDDTSGEPIPEPTYVLHPEGVEPAVPGTIFRGRVTQVAESGHIAICNEPVDAKQTRRWLAKARDERARVLGLVYGFNRGGFDVLVHGLRAFCPVSGIAMENVDDPMPFLGRWAEFHVQTAKSGSQGLVVSRRSIVEKEARKRAKALLKSLEPGQTVKGRVTQVREFGVFVDIGGVEGLVHQSELSWDHGTRPADVAKPGDEIDVKILKVHERENKRERHDRISLSIKALLPDPWDAANEELAEGRAFKGKVVRTAEFGAFVQVAPGIDGLLHVSELGKDLAHANLAVKDGDEVAVVIERVDNKARRISLSKLSDQEAELLEKGELDPSKRAPKIKQGGAIKVVVTQVGSAGLNVRIENVIGKRGRGFIPNAEMGTARGTDHRKQWPPGTEMDVTIIGTDRDGGLRCSRKRFLQDEERKAVRDYRKEVAKQGFGTFGDILRQKLGMDSDKQDSSQE
jgi:small subunit ribosomal protein S1